MIESCDRDMELEVCDHVLTEDLGQYFVCTNSLSHLER